MFEIDLLKGEGIPIKSKPGGAALLAFTVAIPVIAIMIILVNFLYSGILLSMQKQSLERIEEKISNLSEITELRRTIHTRKNGINLCLTEVNDILPKYLSWSPVLEIIARNMPETLVLEELKVTSNLTSDLIVNVVDPSKTKKILKSKRILIITLYRDINQGSDEVVLDFLRSLDASGFIKEKSANVRPLSQTADNRKDTMFYVIECVFES